MARVLEFRDADKFTFFMDGFMQTTRQTDVRLAGKILDKIDEISHPKHSLEDLDESVVKNQAAKMFALSQRELNEGGGEIILEDKEYEYVKECIKQAGWKHWAAQAGRDIEQWIDNLKPVKVEKKDGKIQLVKDTKEPLPPPEEAVNES